MGSNYNLRAFTAIIISQVVEHGQSLSVLLPESQNKISVRDRALLQELCFGCLRTLSQLEWYIEQLTAKAITGKRRTLHYLLVVGLYQLIYTRIPAHAAVTETVNATITLKYPQFKGLINGVLRQFQRQAQQLIARSETDDCRFLHPKWLLQRLQTAYPAKWQNIISANNQKPPMWLRVNRLHHDRDAYQTLLQQAGIESVAHPDYPYALRVLRPCPVDQLPGFDQGWVSVQDLSAQGCVPLLDPKNGEEILDLCAAPGGKTTHILETAPNAKLLSVDIDPLRLTRVRDNLQRLHMKAQIRQGDARNPSTWCHEQGFDRILLDVPCSATGVIRRHPDIKWLRRDSDIDTLAKLQYTILQAIWPYLKSGGVLLYTTCSILPEENEQQIIRFLQHHTDAELCQIGNIDGPGWQKLPCAEEGDGFFYAKLNKTQRI